MKVAQDRLDYIDWVWSLQWRAGLMLDSGDASWDEIAAAAGVEAPRLAPGDEALDELVTVQLYWPGPVPSAT